MEGKITFFNQQEGKGKVLTRQKKVYHFDMDAWVDFDNLPNTGILVEFFVNKEGEVEKISAVEGHENSDGSAGGLEALKTTTECIDEYFSDIKNLIGKYSNTLNVEKELDFFKMKRFLLTAFNDLFELDNGLADNKLEARRNELLSLQTKYSEFRRAARFPLGYAFEKIFLEHQPNYMKILKKKESILQKMSAYALKEKPLQFEIERKEKELETLEKEGKKGSETYQKKDEVLKSLRRQYVDILHYVSNQKETLVLLSRQIDNFQKLHFKSFVKDFEPLMRFLDAKLIKILNVKAYYFDSMMWSRAKNSMIIRQFFIDSGIEGTYSSKTFLKYFLRTLDKEKLNESNKELVNLLKYLESLGSDSVLVIRSNKEAATRTKYLIENIDKEIKVKSTIDASETFKYALKDRPDIIILDYNLRTTNAIEYIKKFREITPEGSSPPNFCIIVDENSIEHIDEIKKLKPKSIINSNLNDEQFMDSIRVIL
jgi:CheY-like chemotaxis protein